MPLDPLCRTLVWLALLAVVVAPSARARAEDRQAPVSFVREVLPVLTRQGCNAGACHGTPSGKNGFRLSLRGYDPALDIASLTRDAHGRRIDPVTPDASLVLLKATAHIPHEGGRRLEPGGTAYALLRRWIAEGGRDDAATAPRLARLDLSPPTVTLDEPADAQQLSVRATFSDGSQR